MAQSQSSSSDAPQNKGQDQGTEREVEARVAMLRGRFGGRLTDDQWQFVRERVAKSMEHGEKLRAAPLTNADEPEIVFAPYRGER